MYSHSNYTEYITRTCDGAVLEYSNGAVLRELSTLKDALLYATCTVHTSPVRPVLLHTLHSSV